MNGDSSQETENSDKIDYKNPNFRYKHDQINLYPEALAALAECHRRGSPLPLLECSPMIKGERQIHQIIDFFPPKIAVQMAINGNDMGLIFLDSAKYSRWPEVKEALKVSGVDPNSFTFAVIYILKKVRILVDKDEKIARKKSVEK